MWVWVRELGSGSELGARLRVKVSVTVGVGARLEVGGVRRASPPRRAG